MSIKLKKENLHNKSHNFIAAGVACYAISLLDEIGLLDQLIEKRTLPSNIHLSYSNPLVVKEAIQTIKCNNIIYYEEKNYKLTLFGEILMQHRGSIGLIYNGYRNVLSNQMDIFKNSLPITNCPLDDSAISKASAQMGAEFFHKKILTILKNHSVHGKICDLGCGNGTTLMYLCRNLKLPGLGIDTSPASIEIAKKQLEPSDKITFAVEDINKICHVYNDVDVLIQSFVMHDFPNDKYKETLQSLRKVFPNARLFLYIDAVSPEDRDSHQLPGFDYVHSLLGTKPKTLQETIQTLAECNFNIINQEPISELTNCYIFTTTTRQENH